MQRFFRTELLLGSEGLKKLKDSIVTIVGLGAVGGIALEALARAGVSNFRLIDFDKLSQTNINRQILALDSNIGEYKVDAASARLQEINPEVNVEVIKEFMNETNYVKVFSSKQDCVIDAIDSLSPKVGLMEHLYNNNIPLVSSMGAAQKIDPFLIRIGDISETTNCSLARHVRNKLKKRGIAEGITCVYSEERSKLNQLNVQEYEEIQEYERGRKRNPLGSISTVTMMFGLLAADYIINLLLAEK